MIGYTATIGRASKTLSVKEKISIKDTSLATPLDELVTPNAPLVITPDFVAEVIIHNEQSENKDYTVYIIVDADGNRYKTSSVSFWTAYTDIVDELADAGFSDPYEIQIYKRESKNYKGKHFLTCSLI